MNASDEQQPAKFLLTDEEWAARLTPEQFRILRRKGTEPPFLNAFNSHKDEGAYVCAGCGHELFRSDAKYASGSGWPSFHSPASEHAVDSHMDHSHGMVRVEVVCSACGGHLGHVFPDGPQPTGMRYCINSGAMDFIPKPTSPPRG